MTLNLRRHLASGIQPCPLPDNAVLGVYTREGGYTDCYATEVSGSVTHEHYVAAFYTTPLFKIERLILKWALNRPATDDQARQLAAGTLNNFAAWRVEKRAGNQLLLCDIFGRTRSWLMVESLTSDAGPATRLYFGSAVVPKPSRSGEPQMGWTFHALLGFHRLYSRALLYSARLRLRSG